MATALTRHVSPLSTRLSIFGNSAGKPSVNEAPTKLKVHMIDGDPKTVI
jgi:hypothetical protein